jgi:hypothetical protein
MFTLKEASEGDSVYVRSETRKATRYVDIMGEGLKVVME